MKKIILGMLVALSSSSVIATETTAANHWMAGISYMNLSDEADDMDISVGGIAGSIGYNFKLDENFYLIPEIRLGTGLGSDSVSVSGIDVDVDVELDRFLALSLRGQFEFDNGIYLYVAPTYANAEFTATASFMGESASASDSSWEFGVGGGIGYQFTETVAAELGYEQFDGTDLLSIGLQFSF